MYIMLGLRAFVNVKHIFSPTIQKLQLLLLTVNCNDRRGTISETKTSNSQHTGLEYTHFDVNNVITGLPTFEIFKTRLSG